MHDGQKLTSTLKVVDFVILACKKSGLFRDIRFSGSSTFVALIHTYVAVQNQKAVTAHFTIKQLLPIGFAWQHVIVVYNV